MIAMLRGIVSEKLLDRVILDCGGVGYGVFVSRGDHDNLYVDNESRLYIYEHIREQSHDLYGFVDTGTKRLFEQLLDVNGVGPRMALNILSIGSADQVRNAIASSDLKFLQSAAGVGKRVAERLVLDLKDKVGGLDNGLSHELSVSVSSGDDAIEALIALGYSPADAANALSGIDHDLPVETRISQALRGVGR